MFVLFFEETGVLINDGVTFEDKTYNVTILNVIYDMLIYNVHALTHLVKNVRKLGPLQNVSTFPF